MRPAEAQRQGLIFDFDGVIALSEPVHVRAWEDLARHLGRPLPEGFLQGGLGRADGELAEELARAWGDGRDGGALLALKRQFYRRRSHEENVLVPGIAEALPRLAERYGLGLASSSALEDVLPTLERYGLRGYFRTMLTIEAVQRPKPDPEIYLKAAAGLGFSPRACWGFEDSVQGARAVRAAGARLIGVTTTLPAAALEPLDGHVADFQAWERLAWILCGEGSAMGE